MIHIRKYLSSLNKVNQSNNFITIKNSFLFSNKNDDNNRPQKVFIDEQAIKKKIKKMREQRQFTGQQKQKKKKLQFMPTFTIPEVNKKVQDFRRQTQTQELFAFSDITLEQKPTKIHILSVLQITAYDNDFIEVDNYAYPPSVILTPNQILNWQVQDSQSIRIQHFSILKCIRPIPEYVIVGVPDSTVISPDLKKKIKEIHHNVDILDLFQAISQFNTVANSDRFIMAFIMTN